MTQLVQSQSDYARNPNQADDAPGNLLIDDFNAVTRSDAFQAFFMYRPGGPESIWIPIGMLPWGWGGTATRTITNPDDQNVWTGPTNSSRFARAHLIVRSLPRVDSDAQPRGDLVFGPAVTLRGPPPCPETPAMHLTRTLPQWLTAASRCRPAGALLLLPLAMCSAAAQQQRPQRPKPDGRVVEAVLESEHPTYHVGDRIRLRVALHNTASVPVSFVPYPSNLMVSLRITRQDGSEARRRWSGGGGGTSGVTSTTLEPGQTWVVRADTTEWTPLNYWGYDLREPGHYTVVGIPQIMGIEVVSDWKTVRSNKATFTILP